jgi:hypothetical protein
MKLTGMLFLFFTIANATAQAETLRADSLICENRDRFALLSRLIGSIKTLSPKGTGANLMRIVSGMKNINDSLIHAHQRLSDREVAENQEVEAFLSECMATTNSENISIVERSPISGLTKIRLSVNGVIAEVWTISSYID